MYLYNLCKECAKLAITAHMASEIDKFVQILTQKREILDEIRRISLGLH